MPIMATFSHLALRGRPRSSSTMSQISISSRGIATSPHSAIPRHIGGLTTITSVTILAHLNVISGIVARSVVLGKTYSSSSAGAGELGHVMVLLDGPVGDCGNYGRLLRLASESAIIRSVGTRMRQFPGVALQDALPTQSLGALSMPLVIEAAALGDPVVL